MADTGRREGRPRGSRGPRGRKDRSELLYKHTQHMVRRGLRANTIKIRLAVIRRLELHAGRPLLEITTDDIRAFLDRLADSGSRATELTQIRAFYKWATLEAYMDIDPSFRVERIRRRKYLPRPISDDELAKALVNAPERVAPMLWMAAYAGLRACDIAQLRGEHIMLDRTPPILFIAESKGGKPRTVPIAPILASELQGRVPGYGWVFPRRDGRDGPLPPHMISRLCCDYLHEIGIDATLHQLRHWFVTKVYAVNRDLVVAQELAGHESIATTRLYTWVDPGAAAATVNQLPEL